MDGIDELRQFSRENLHRIWKTTKEGRTLMGEEHRLAEAMRAHPEYHNAWEFADLTGPKCRDLRGENRGLTSRGQSVTRLAGHPGSVPGMWRARE